MKYVDETKYITIQGWMRNILQLKGTDLLIYAIIYGFSQQEGHWFNGSLQYLADWTGTSKQCCMNSLKKLLDKEYIKKEEIFENGIKYCRYAKKFNGIQESCIGGIQKSLTNNINNNINIIKDNISMNENIEPKNNNIDINKSNKRKTKKQLLLQKEKEYDITISNLINEFTDNKSIQKLLEQYVEVRKQRGILTPAQFMIILDDLKTYCGDNLIHQEMCIRKAIAGGWSQIVFIDNFKGKAKTSYSSFDNTAGHFTGNEKITDEQFEQMSFEEQKAYANKMALADMTKKQREFFNQYCLARDENGNLLEF